MQVCSAVAVFVSTVVVLCPAALLSDDGTIPTEPKDSTANTPREPPCIQSGACRIVRTTKVPSCPGMEVIETVTTRECCVPPAYECQRRSYWLRDAQRTEPVLLTEDCVEQIGADTLGVATMRITKCDLVINYMQLFEDDGCQVRTLGIHLDALRLFGQAEGTGNQQKGRCKACKTKPVQYPRGKGTPDSPLVRLDGPTVEEERAHARALEKAARTSAAGGIATPKNNITPPDAAQPGGNAKGPTR